jgi:D-alanine-D-alanine ligase
MKKNIALVTGGYSGEAVISYKSAEAIYKNIDTEKWNCYLIDIHPDGWFYKTGEGEKINVDKNDFTIILNGQKIKFDAVLVGLHGNPGEDGKLQGYFDCLGIPYTSCDAATSALTFNNATRWQLLLLQACMWLRVYTYLRMKITPYLPSQINYSCLFL